VGVPPTQQALIDFWLGWEASELKVLLHFASLNLHKFQHTCKFALFPGSFPVTVWPTAHTVFADQSPVLFIARGHLQTNPLVHCTAKLLHLVVVEAEYMHYAEHAVPWGSTQFLMTC